MPRNRMGASRKRRKEDREDAKRFSKAPLLGSRLKGRGKGRLRNISPEKKKEVGREGG